MVLDKKCNNCGAKVTFDPISQKLKCDYCNSKFDITEESEEEIKNDSKDLDIYNCPSCGANIICEPNTTSTFCVYCKNTAILKDKLKGDFLPQAIIPFKSIKQDAIDAFTALKEGKKLVPDAFLDPKNIDEIRGIYIPFWLYDFNVYGEMTAKTYNRYTRHFGNTTTITTKEYLSERKGDIIYDNIPIDGSTHFQNNIMRSIEPFDYNEIKKYSSDYLSGFLSELYDTSKEEAHNIAYERAKQTVYNLFYQSIKDVNYDEINIINNNFNIQTTNIHYVLFPVWMLNVKYKDKFYTFAMNGQTKKMIGDIPVDKTKARKYYFKFFLISLVMCLIIAVLIWKAVW